MLRVANTVAVLIFMLVAGGVHAQLVGNEPWRRVDGGHVLVYSNRSAAGLADVSRGLHAFLEILTTVVGEPSGKHREPCTTMLLYEDRRSLDALLRHAGSASPRGFVMRTPDTTYLVSADASDVYGDVARSYLRAHHPSMPAWLENGLRQTLGAYRHEPSRLVVAVPRREHLRWLSRNAPFDLEPLVNTADARQMDATDYEVLSWALTQLLLFETPRGFESLHRYLELTRTGGDALRSFEEAFGLDVKSAGDALRVWLSQKVLTPYEQSADRNPAWETRQATRSEVLLHHGNVLLHGGEENRAVAIGVYREAVAEDSNNAGARAMLGIALKESGRREEAIEHLAAATRADVANPLAFLAHAELLLERSGRRGIRFGDSDPPPAAVLEARALLRRSIALDRSLAPAWAALAKTWIFDRAGFDEGIAAADESLAIGPRSEDAALSLVLLHLRKNDIERAAESLERRLRPIARQATIDVAERGIIAWKLHRANTLAQAGELARASALVAEVMATAADETLRTRLALDMEQIELTKETIRLTEIYNRAVRATNQSQYEVALKLVEQILREARDPSLRRDAENMKRTIKAFLKRP
ncbi:MAG TPA: tetratricopeptide repeat protein [Thermoanaerobaculia bacterium]|nr:tetratricopeptide repeat protein [Thermoanaerobaculia bacterium]